MTYIKENTITKLQKLYSPPRNPTAGNKLHMLFVKKPLGMGDLSTICKIFIERPVWINVAPVASIIGDLSMIHDQKAIALLFPMEKCLINQLLSESRFYCPNLITVAPL